MRGDHSRMRANPSGTNINQQSAFGRRETVKGDGTTHQLGRIQLELDSMLTISAETANLKNFPSEDLTVQPLCQIKWGNGNVLFTKIVQPLFHIDVPVCASTVEINCFIGNPFAQNPAATPTKDITISADFVVSVSEGVTGLPQRQSIVQVSSGLPATSVAAGPQRILSVRGYNLVNTVRWLMGFDHFEVATALIPNGTLPQVSIPMPAGGAGNPTAFSDSFLNTRAFRDGLTWVVSSTPDTLTRDGGASVRIETELALV
jgi:hypothetical protein